MVHGCKRHEYVMLRRLAVRLQNDSYADPLEDIRSSVMKPSIGLDLLRWLCLAIAQWFDATVRAVHDKNKCAQIGMMSPAVGISGFRLNRCDYDRYVAFLGWLHRNIRHLTLFEIECFSSYINGDVFGTGIDKLEGAEGECFAVILKAIYVIAEPAIIWFGQFVKAKQ